MKRWPTRPSFPADWILQQVDRFIGMYVNELTLDYGEDGRKAVRLLLSEAYKKKIIPKRSLWNSSNRGQSTIAARYEELASGFSRSLSEADEGELEEAVELYRKSIESFPTAEAYTFLGWTYSFMGRLDDAIAECHKAIEVDPEFGNPYNDIGAYLLQQGQVDEAIPWFRRALEAPRYESYCFPHVNLGRAYEAKHEWISAAIREFEQASSQWPDYRPARQGLARIRALLN